MRNISFLNKDSISLKQSEVYLVIDALYLMDVKEKISASKNGNIKEFLMSIKKNVFQYCETPFTKYFSTSSTEFDIKSIKKINYDDILGNFENYFSTDTGLVFFINLNILKEFVLKFDYDLLVIDSEDLFEFDYWDKITSDFDKNDIAMVYSMESNGNIEFCGGGIYTFM